MAPGILLASSFPRIVTALTCGAVVAAITSGCFPYEFGGAVVLVGLLLSLTHLALLCYYGIRQQHAVWKHITVKEAVQNMKDVLKESQGQGLYTRAVKMREALDVLVFRGEWESEDHPERKDVVHTSFVDRCPPLPSPLSDPTD